jgi:pimeloyl-ACP methyl ester carboxylesterase
MTRYGDSTLTVVVVHGAWADGSSWNKVTQPLQAQGLHVIAAPIPLTSLSDDVRALDRVLERTSGPVVVGAHAYAGAVISATTNVRVQGLVFIAALTPDEGETVADVFYRGAPHAQAPKLQPDTHGLIWMPEPSFSSAFAQDAAPEQAALLAATQRPISVACIREKSPPPLWKRKPAWYLVATQDRMINPDTQRFMATRMGARTRIEDVDHTPIVTNPNVVVEVFAAAIDGTAKNSSM